MTTTRIQVQGPTTLQSGGGSTRPWIPINNTVALSRINGIEPAFNNTALTTFPQPRDGFRLWGTTDLPIDANGAAIVSIDVETAGRRGGGAAGSNYNFAFRDNVGGTAFGTRHFMPYGAGPIGFHIRFDNLKSDPNGDVWRSEFINSSNFEMGLFQNPGAASGVSVSYIDFEVLWAGASAAWTTIGICLLLPLLLPVLGGMNLYHMNDAELARVHHVIKNASKIVGEASYPSIVLREEKEMVLKALSRPTYGV